MYGNKKTNKIITDCDVIYNIFFCKLYDDSCRRIGDGTILV